MKVIVLLVIVVIIWQWNCSSSLPTKNETLHRCPYGHHRDPENLERTRRNIFTKVSTTITKATKYVGKKLHIIKRDVSPVLNHNETDAALSPTIIRVTRSETQLDNSTTTTHNGTFTDQVENDNSTVVGKETVEPQRLIRQLGEIEQIQTNESKVFNITSTDNRSDVTKLPQGQANITFFIQFFNSNDTNVLEGIKAETPIAHHHHHSKVTKRDANEDEIVRGTVVNDTHIAMKYQEIINKSMQKSTHMRKCTCIVTFGSLDPLLSETSVEDISEPLLADLICSNACSQLTKIYYTTEQQKFCKRIDTILRTVLQTESKNVDVTRDLIYCQVLPEREISEEPVFPEISNVIMLNVFACLIGLIFLLSAHLLCSICFYAGKKQKEKWAKAGVTTTMGSIRVKQNKAGNVV